MKLKYIYLFLFLTTTIHSQISIGVSGGANLFRENLSGYQDYISYYWHKGFNFNIGGEYFITHNFSINSVIEYGFYKFDNYINTGTQPTLAGHIYSTGEDSRAIRIFANLRVYTDSSNIVQGFAFTGIGYIAEDIGAITIIYDYMNSGQIINELYYPGRNYFVHTFGIGGRVKVNQNFRVDVSGSYFSDYSKILNGKAEISFVYLFNN